MNTLVSAEIGCAPPISQPASQVRSLPHEHRSSRVRHGRHARLEGRLGGARAAGLSRGAYLSGLVAGVPVLTTGASRIDHLVTLVASSAELSTLSRNIHHLTSLLRQGNGQPALAYRAMLDTLAGDVHDHLMLASRVLADLRPRGRHGSVATRLSP